MIGFVYDLVVEDEEKHLIHRFDLVHHNTYQEF
jgi:hypothetical protein